MRLLFLEYYISIPYIISFMNLWLFFFKTNFYTLIRKTLSIDLNVKRNILKNINNKLYLYVILIHLLFFILVFFSIKSSSTFFWWNHLIITNYINSTIFFMLALNIISVLIIYSYTNSFTKINYNFFFAIANLFTLMTIIFFSNTYFTFFFILELVSLFMFYKLTSSKLFIHNTSSFFSFSRKKLVNIFNKIYSNMLFFLYWTTFFGSIFFVYTIINLLYYFGTTEWFLLNFLFKTSFLTNSSYFFNIYLIILLITFSFFLKSGLTPFHLYKIELYKGMPYITIFFYNTFYFLYYYFIFIFLIFLNLNEFYIVYASLNYYLFFFIIFFIVSYLFSINYAKAFFAYSTILNSILFLFLAFSLVC